jgi:Zn-finger nucleic acid-binding protein
MLPVAGRNYLHCSHCDSYDFPEDIGDGVQIVGDPISTDCPVCRRALQTAIIEGQGVGYCTNCRGILSAMDEFAEFVERRRAKHALSDHAPVPFDPEELKRLLHCPTCHQPMDCHLYAGGGTVVVDTCELCNLIWLDAGELALIERYVPRPHRYEAV